MHPFKATHTCTYTYFWVLAYPHWFYFSSNCHCQHFICLGSLDIFATVRSYKIAIMPGISIKIVEYNGHCVARDSCKSFQLTFSVLSYKRTKYLPLRKCNICNWFDANLHIRCQRLTRINTHTPAAIAVAFVRFDAFLICFYWIDPSDYVTAFNWTIYVCVCPYSCWGVYMWIHL